MRTGSIIRHHLPHFRPRLAVGRRGSIDGPCRVRAAGKPCVDVLLPEEYLAPRPQLDVCQPPCGPCLVDDRQRTRNLLGELLAGNQISHYHTPPPVPSHQCPAREQCGQPFSDLRHDLKLHC
uniref:Uncharacterized protein n=1 Tax=Siphoviridae sp. ctZZK17 TaxID=2826384 RepID=A0A8S5MNM5_9CAUD|nr:MAG TPA: hypothetical protein [Siphoviridae sp. ctZZK17]